MAIKGGTVNNTSITEEMNKLRTERNSNVPRSLRRWREDHPNYFRDNTRSFASFLEKKQSS